MTRQIVIALLAAATAIFAAPAAVAQTPDMKTASGMAQAAHANLKRYIVKAAEKMPEENYSFKPVPEIRSFGELLGHIANAQYNYCSGASSEKNPNTVNIEKTKTSKADIVAALEGSFAHCDKAYASLSDAKIGEMGKMGNNERNKFGILSGNNTHINEHYGNLVTYMRIKGIVPPSSEGR